MGKASRKRKMVRPRASPERGEQAHQPKPAAIDWGRGALWVSLALAAAIGVVYWPVRLFPFVNTDDPVYVTANARVLGGLSWSNIQWALSEARVPYWHPLTFLSHMLDVQLYARNAGGHHATSVILHIVTAVLLFGLMLQMTGKPGRSAVVAALFGLHPLRVESVAWIAERKDVLSTLLWIATTWAYVRYVRKPETRRYALVVVLFALGLMAKPMIVTLPFALLLLDYWPLGRLDFDTASQRRDTVSLRAALSEKIPLFILAALGSMVTFSAQRDVGAVNSLDAIPFSLRLANALQSYVAYIGDLFWPVRLAAIYPYPPAIDPLGLTFAVVVLAVITTAAFLTRRRWPYLLVGWLWYLGTLLPVIGLVQVGPQARADRFTYIPHIGLLMMVAWGLPDLVGRIPNLRPILAPLAAAAVVACAVISRSQVAHWQSSTALWEHTLAVTRDNGVAHYNLGAELAGKGENDEAIRHLTEAVRLAPDFASAHNRLGLALARRGDYTGATAQLAEVVRLMPASSEAYSNLGVSLAREGKNAEAIEAFSQAVLLNPQDVEAKRRLEFLRRGGSIKVNQP